MRIKWKVNTGGISDTHHRREIEGVPFAGRDLVKLNVKPRDHPARGKRLRSREKVYTKYCVTTRARAHVCSSKKKITAASLKLHTHRVLSIAHRYSCDRFSVICVVFHCCDPTRFKLLHHATSDTNESPV